MQLLVPNTLIITALAIASLTGAAPFDVPGPGPIVGHSHGNTSPKPESTALATPTPVPHGAGPGCGTGQPNHTMLTKRGDSSDKPLVFGLDDAVAAVKQLKVTVEPVGDEKLLQRRADGTLPLTVGAKDFAALMGYYNRLRQGKPDNGKVEFAVVLDTDTFTHLTGTNDEMKKTEQDRLLQKRDDGGDDDDDDDAAELQRRGNIFKDVWLGLTQEHFHTPLIPGSTNRHDAIPPPFYLDKPGWDIPAREEAARQEAAREERKKVGGG